MMIWSANSTDIYVRCLKLSLPLPLPGLETSLVVLAVNGRLGIMYDDLNSNSNFSNK